MSQRNLKASVIVRSYNRVFALNELVQNLLKQDYAVFEVIIVEQSTKFKQQEMDQLNELSNDLRVKLIKSEPLGGPAARNEGVKNATGDILIFIDDDDLPASKDWITKHLKAYEDEKLVGFTGRHIFEGTEGYPYLKGMRWYFRRKVLQYNWLKFPTTFAQFDEDVSNVAWLHGTNSSIRKEWVFKTTLWDTHVSNQDEHSFAFKLKLLLTDGYHLDFRKGPEVIRRMGLEGGMAKRSFSYQEEWLNQYGYLTKVLYKYNSYQWFLFPFHLLFITFKTIKSGFN